MPTFTITIDTANAAFDGAPRYEVARLLREVAKDVEETGRTTGFVYDVNGNRVGGWSLT